VDTSALLPAGSRGSGGAGWLPRQASAPALPPPCTCKGFFPPPRLPALLATVSNTGALRWTLPDTRAQNFGRPLRTVAGKVKVYIEVVDD